MHNVLIVFKKGGNIKLMKSFILSLIIIFFNMAVIPSIEAEITDTKIKKDSTEKSVYKVGVNDVIEIKVLEHDEFHALSTVSSDGTIILPYIGTVFVKEKTLTDIEAEITKKLSEGYLKYPVVSVSLVKSMSKAVFVYGEVGRPGAYPLEEGNTTILRVLSLAGGINNEGLHGDIKLRRKQKSSSEYKESYLGSRDTIEKTDKGNMILNLDDILIIERNKTFLIQGEVVRVGRYALEKDMTVLRALIEAGGVTADGLHGIVKVRRKTAGGIGGYQNIVASELKNGIILGGEEVEDTVLQSDDILLVERNQTFLIQGEVMKRGRYALEKDTTLVKALLEAGGVTDEGRYGKIKLRRKIEGKIGEYKDFVQADLTNGVIGSNEVEDTVINPDDILIVERNKTFFIYGEVGRTGQFVLEEGMTVTKAISLAGGIRSDGLYGKVKIRRKQGAVAEYSEEEIDLEKMRGNSLSDVLLQPDDIVIVGRNDTFFLYGEVNKPGEYILKEGMTVFQAITIGGGFTKWGSKSRVKILRPQKDKSGFAIMNVDIGDVIDGDLSSDLELQHNDIVVVSSGAF